jgi:hypothetical protein
MEQRQVDACRVTSHHEAGHIVAGWIQGLPLRAAYVKGSEGAVYLSRFYLWTSMFREVNQETVRQKVLFIMSGRCASALAGFDDREEVWHSDAYLPWYLGRKFALDTREIAREAEHLVQRNKRPIKVVAERLYQQGSLDWYELALMRMDLLAQGSLIH